MINKEQKDALVAQFQAHPKDTGSVVLQVALLTERINTLNEHFKKFAKDNASKTGMMKLVGRRRKFLKYIEETDEAQYKDIIARLGLRR